MKGLLYYGNRDLRYSENIEEPTIQSPNEVLIDVAYCGICGSDLHEYLDGPIFFKKAASATGDELSGAKLPMCPGHELSGVISKIGDGVKTLKVGDRVVVEASATCVDRKRVPKSKNLRYDTPECSNCKRGITNCCLYLNFCGLGYSSGGFADKLVASEEHTVKITDNIPFDVAALTEPLSVAWHAVRISKLKEGDTAIVLGAGPIGLATILALQGHKAGRIVVSEIASIRREQAKSFGAEVFNSADYKSTVEAIEALKKLTNGAGFQYAFDASGVKPTFDTSIGVLGARGIAVNIAIWPNKPIDFYPMNVTLEEKFYTGSIGYTRQDFEEVIEAIEKGLIDLKRCKSMITGVVGLKDSVDKGFVDLMKHKDKHIKMLITPNNGLK